MATPNQNTNGAYIGSGHIMIACENGLRTQHRLISISPRFIFCMEYGSVSRVSLATVIRVLEPGEKVTH